MTEADRFLDATGSIGRASDPSRAIRASKWVAILCATVASLTLGRFLLDPELHPLDVPSAIVGAALYFQPALLMILPQRRASLDLAAAVIAAILGVGLFLLPYTMNDPWVVMTGLFTVACAIAAFVRNSLRVDTKGDAVVALLAVVLMAGAFFCAEISTRPMCRTSPMTTSCDDAAVSYMGAAATVGALWIAAGIVWLAARRAPGSEPDGAYDRERE